MHTALTLGGKFAFLTVNERYVPIISGNIVTYGLGARAITKQPVRRFAMTFEALSRCLKGQDDEFLAAFEKTALECIADGADVIVAGGQLFGPVFQKYKYFTVADTGVPVVEVSACGLKMAQSLAELAARVGLRKSEHVHSPFRTPDADVTATALRTFGVR